MKKITTKIIVVQALIAAVYTVLTIILGEFAYGPVQFRYSEVMTLLAFFNPVHVIGLTLGCVVSNFFSSLGMLDVIIGSLATFLATYGMTKVKNIYIASVFPALEAFIIAALIAYLSNNLSLIHI